MAYELAEMKCPTCRRLMFRGIDITGGGREYSDYYECLYCNTVVKIGTVKDGMEKT